MAGPTFHAAEYMRHRRSEMRAFSGGSDLHEGFHWTHSPGVGPDRVSYLKQLGRRSLAGYCDLLIAKRMKGYETEYQSPETDAHRAAMSSRRHPLGPKH